MAQAHIVADRRRRRIRAQQLRHRLVVVVVVHFFVFVPWSNGGRVLRVVDAFSRSISSTTSSLPLLHSSPSSSVDEQQQTKQQQQQQQQQQETNQQRLPHASAAPGMKTSKLSSSIWGRSSTSSSCDDSNLPPALSMMLRSLHQLTVSASTGADIRGVFVDHPRVGGWMNVAQSIARHSLPTPGSPPALTPLAAYCLGKALAQMLHDQLSSSSGNTSGVDDDDDNHENHEVRIVLGRDPRTSGVRLADMFARGAESVMHTHVLYTGLATTPAMASFVSSIAASSHPTMTMVSASVMITASHLPMDRNGFKLFVRRRRQSQSTGSSPGMTRSELADLGLRAQQAATTLFEAQHWKIPPSSSIQLEVDEDDHNEGSSDSVCCSAHVEYMPHYARYLSTSILEQSSISSGTKHHTNDYDKKEHLDSGITTTTTDLQQPLHGLRIVVNAGHGSGGFLAHVLEELGAEDVLKHSIGINPDPTFPLGIPNPELASMIEQTVEACRQARANVGILLDTDADRCGLVVPTNDHYTSYEPLHRNRLIALLGVMYAQSHPGCTIVTDSVTSEALTHFLTRTLQLKHVRYLKGYANVIGKAMDLVQDGNHNVQVAIETSGHCALRENHFFLDDGTYTAGKVVSWLAAHSHDNDNPHDERNTTPTGRRGLLLLDWIREYHDLPFIREIRLPTLDQSLITTQSVFDVCAVEIEMAAVAADHDPDPLPLSLQQQLTSPLSVSWRVDRDNLEGIRVRFGAEEDEDEQCQGKVKGQFFMLRKSLHDPLISLHIEATSVDQARQCVVQPLIQLLESSSSSASSSSTCSSNVASILNLTALRNFS